MKKKRRKTLYNWLTNRYQLIIRNEENFAEKTTFSFNYARVILFFFLFCVLIFVASIYFGKNFLGSWYNPDYADSKRWKEIGRLSAKVDSMKYEYEQLHQYNMVFKSMLAGGDDFAQVLDTVKPEKIDFQSLKIDSLSPLEQKIFDEFIHSDEEPQLTATTEFTDNIRFPSPMDLAKIAEKYSFKDDLYGIRLTAKPQSVVRSVESGVIVWNGWTKKDGNIVVVQHRDNVLSVYKNVSTILKKVGSFVQAGDLIAVAGDNKEETGSIFFELWMNGQPVNPENYLKL